MNRTIALAIGIGVLFLVVACSEYRYFLRWRL